MEKKGKQKKKNRRRENILYVAGFVLFMLILLFPSGRSDAMDMLSVGQGDCLVLRTRAGHCVIVDAGSASEKEIGKYRLIPYLKYHGIRRVDAVFLSHAHADHISGVLELFAVGKEEGILVKKLVVSVQSKGEQDYEPVLEAARKADTVVFFMKQKDKLRVGNMEVICIFEGEKGAEREENDSSMVLLARWDKMTILLAGDSTSACDASVIENLKQQGIFHVDCLKVSHHGSGGSTSQELLDYLQPKIALISCGYNNRYGHPHEETLSRLKEMGSVVYRTDVGGQIRVYCDKAGHLRCERGTG